MQANVAFYFGLTKPSSISQERSLYTCLEPRFLQLLPRGHLQTARSGDQTGPPWWFRWQRICLQCRRTRFDPWFGKISWRREWLPTPVFMPREFKGQRNLVGYSPWDFRKSNMTEPLTTNTL